MSWGCLFWSSPPEDPASISFGEFSDRYIRLLDKRMFGEAKDWLEGRTDLDEEQGAKLLVSAATREAEAVCRYLLTERGVNPVKKIVSITPSMPIRLIFRKNWPNVELLALAIHGLSEVQHGEFCKFHSVESVEEWISSMLAVYNREPGNNFDTVAILQTYRDELARLGEKERSSQTSTATESSGDTSADTGLDGSSTVRRRR